MTQVALVTGGSRGIGAATARVLAAKGWDVCVSFRQEATRADTVVERCRELGRRAIAARADMAVEDDICRLFDVVDEQLGPIGVLVNNAGVVPTASRLEDFSWERIDRLLQINVLGSFLCTREAVRRMSTRHGGEGGAIVNVSSAASRIGSPGEWVDYAASKAAIDTMTIGLAQEVADEAIRVNAVRPGLIDTDIHASGGQPERVARMATDIPMRRGGRPEEVAEAIGWLCSPGATYVTGALIDVAGGR